MPKNKKFHKSAIGRICYLAPSKEAVKLALKQFKHKCTPCIGLLKPNGDGTLAILNSSTGKILNQACNNVPPNFLEVATPVKAKYDPELINLVIK